MNNWELRRSIAALAVAAAVAGCAALPQQWLGKDETRQLGDLLTRYEALVTQPTEEQQRELAAAQAAVDAGPDELARLRLALAWSQLPAVRDDGRVVALVADWRAGPEVSLAREIALVLQRQAVERLRAAKELRDEQRRSDGLRDDVRRNETQLRDEKKRSEELQQKLEALRAIDRETRRAGRQ